VTVNCKGCGARVLMADDGSAIFCGGCGTYVPAAKAAKPINRQPKNYKIAAIAVGASTAVAVAVMAIVFFWPNAQMSAYEKAERAFFRSLVAPITEMSGGKQYNLDLSFTPGRDAGGLLPPGLDDLSLSGSLAAFGESFLATFTVRGGDGAVGGAVAYDDAGLTLSFPSISQYFIRLALNPNELGGVIGAASSLDVKALQANLTAIANKYFEIADRVAVISDGVTVSGGGITLSNANRHVMAFRENDLLELAIAAMRELRNNGGFMDFLDANFHTEDFDGARSMFDEGIREIQGQMRSNASNDVLFRMTVYIHGGEIVSREIRIGDHSSEVVISYMRLERGDELYVELYCEMADDWNDMIFTVAGEFKRGNGGWNGPITMSYATRATDWWDGTKTAWERLDFTVNVANYRKVGGIHEGILTFSQIDGGDGVEITVELARRGADQAVYVRMAMVEVYHRMEIGTVNIFFSSAPITALQMPALNNRNAAVPGAGDGNWRRLYDDLYSALDIHAGNDLLEGLIYGFINMVETMFWDEWWESDLNHHRYDWTW
jgi:hypothetical protein